MLLNNTDNSP